MTDPDFWWRQRAEKCLCDSTGALINQQHPRTILMISFSDLLSLCVCSDLPGHFYLKGFNEKCCPFWCANPDLKTAARGFFWKSSCGGWTTGVVFLIVGGQGRLTISQQFALQLFPLLECLFTKHLHVWMDLKHLQHKPHSKRALVNVDALRRFIFVLFFERRQP